MNKTILIVFLVVTVAAGLFLLTRSNKKEKQVQQISKESFIKLTRIAKKIPNAGLTQMGGALNRYYEDNGSYPATLKELHPDYIPVEEFIRDIDWEYERRDNDFYLGKIIVKNNKQMIAYIDKTLVPKMDTGAIVATAEDIEEVPEVAIDEDMTATSSLLVTLKPLDLVMEEEQQVESIIEQVEIVSVVEGEVGSGVSSDISNKMLVWKNENGVLGFGNVKYPETPEMAIYRNNSWVGLKRPPPRLPENPTVVEKDTEKNFESKALAMDNRFVVWKSRDGGIGIGNVQAPQLDDISALRVDGTWVTIEKGLPELEKWHQPVFTATQKEKAQNIEDIAENLSGSYLVWMDKNGDVGFGNMQGPRPENLSAICVDGQWITIEADSDHHKIKLDIPKPVKEKATAEEITEQLSKHYLIWKDKNGVMGYGNVQSPESDNITAIYVDGGWVNIEKDRPVIPPEQHRKFKYVKKDIDQIALDYSDNYLVWKDKSGKIGFGNVNYPEIDNIAYININGTWQEVIN